MCPVDDVEVRLAAIDRSLRFHDGKGTVIDTVVADAEKLLQFVESRALHLRIRIGLIVDQSTGNIRIDQGGPEVQLHDTEQVDLTVQALDSKGYPVADSISATSSDDTVVTLQQSGNTFTAAAQAPGSATITFTDGNLSATEAIDVVPGDVAKITIAEGTPVPQNPA